MTNKFKKYSSYVRFDCFLFDVSELVEQFSKVKTLFQITVFKLCFALVECAL